MGTEKFADESGFADLERTAYMTLINDGLLDIGLGILVLTHGLIFATDIHLFGETDVFILLPILTLPLWKVVRKFVVEPRVGVVSLKEERVRWLKTGKRKVAGTMAAFSVLGVLALLAFSTWIQPVGDSRSIVVGIMLAIPVAVAAQSFGIWRWYVLALLILIAPIVEVLTSMSFGVAWVIAGIVIMMIGVSVLVTFLQSYSSTTPMGVADA